MGIAVVWFRARHKSDLSAEFALASVGLILIQPHAMYYDMGLVLFAYLMISCYRRKNVKDLILLWILAIIQVSARPLGFSPLFSCYFGPVFWESGLSSCSGRGGRSAC